MEGSIFDARFSRPDTLSHMLFGWDDEGECRYRCMMSSEKMHRTKGKEDEHRQYYGKWPFRRIFGMQEFFSCLFSLANLAAHSVGYFWIYRGTRRSFLTGIHRTYYCISAATWLCSFVFHARDTSTTEFLDYFFAFASLLYALYMCIIRLLRIASPASQKIILAPFVFILFKHYYEMATIRFDYEWNMTLNIAVALSHNLIWLLWALGPLARLVPSASLSLHHESSGKAAGDPPRYQRKIVYFVLLISAASLLETIDFAPILQLVDTHALWHAATAPLVLLYWSFHRDDVLYLAHIQRPQLQHHRKGMQQ